MKEIGVKSIGWYLPEKRLINEDLEGMADTTGQWMLTRTGIREHRIAGKDIATSAWLCVPRAPHWRPSHYSRRT